MKILKSVFNNRRRCICIILAVVSFAVMIWNGKYHSSIAFPFLFLVAGFCDKIDGDLVLNFLWLAGNILLSCCVASWMQDICFLILKPKIIFLNYVCVGTVYGIVILLVGRFRPGVIAASLGLLLLYLANVLVFQFRGTELHWADFLSIRTAMSVAAGYDIELPGNTAGSILLCIAGLACVYLIPALQWRPWAIRSAAALLVAACVAVFSCYSGDVTPWFWQAKGTKRNGYPLNLALGFRDSFIQQPEQYDESIAKLDADYPPQKDVLPEELPDIVVIMSEALADFQVLGSKPQTSVPVTPFLDSLQENTIRGYALSPVFGGNTASSEFEFLTGSSMRFLPGGSIAYQQYLRQKTDSLPWLLQSYGYETAATHPYYRNGWNRSNVYPLLGFQEATFLEDYPGEDLVREYISDREMVCFILDRLNRQGDAPLFLFGISMQNHGGYTDSEYTPTLTLEGSSYPKAEQYLSLIHESDTAFSELFSSLESSPRKTIVLIFGDHFPTLETAFYRELHAGSFDTLSEQMLQYQVPFYLWANFDIPEQSVPLIGMSSLPILLLKSANLPLSPYYRFLSDVQQVVPAMNPFCVYTTDGHTAMAEADSEQVQWLTLYKAAQYRNLFDRKKS